MKKWGVGHLYRSSSPYSVPLPQMDQNHIYLINLFGRSSDEIQLFEERLKKRVGDSRFIVAKETFERHRESFQKFKDYFFKDVAVRDLDWFIENINNKIK